jgi:protein-S-isoprenylcysteine O-methyltransferase Ste14
MQALPIERAILWGWLALSAITFTTLLIIDAPYGRHGRSGWGPGIPPRWGWLIMEAPAALVLPALALPSLLRQGWSTGWLLVGAWLLHYVNRAFVFPFRLRSTRPMPLSVMGMAIVFNVMNGWLNAHGLLAPELGRATWGSPRVLCGLLLFLVGLFVNWDADARLLRLRAPGGEYAIPRGGLYEWISCPNYFGELIEWSGFALAAGSFAALGFVVWTFANLAPRALAHHRWYRERFPDYPRTRRALIPFLW